MSVVDSAMTREVLRDISKRPLDISELHVNVMHGVVYLRGKVEKLRGYYGDIDLGEEFRMLTKILRQKPGIREIVCEVEMGGLSLAERAGQYKSHRPSDH